jgi:hypothetical protein
MSKGRQRFTEREARRLIRAMRAEGIEPGGVKLDADGSLVILTKDDDATRTDGVRDGARGWANVQ